MIEDKTLFHHRERINGMSIKMCMIRTTFYFLEFVSFKPSPRIAVLIMLKGQIVRRRKYVTRNSYLRLELMIPYILAYFCTRKVLNFWLPCVK